MSLLIGTDEAGYGPNLGPLVITATSWELPDGMIPSDMWATLKQAITDVPSRGDDRLHVADSKKVYTAGKPITSLERSVHAFLRHLQYPTEDVGRLGTTLGGPRFASDYRAVCQDTVTELQLPASADKSHCESAAQRVQAALTRTGVRLLGIGSRIIFTPEFNRGVEATGSKGRILSSATLQLVREAVCRAGVPAAGWVVCDKHGGRNRYDDVISEAFEDEFVFRLEESGPRSRYRVGELEFCFRTQAEEVMPVALASMVSKYLREVIMMQFNRFWQQQLPDLKATKGYPVDARRFWNDIQGRADELGIARSEIWRCR
ncbi:MAG: hypothetical protein RIK87_20105 [Fuerstiella sp.]